MVKSLKILLTIVFFALLALPTLRFFGVEEGWTRIYGWEKDAPVPPLTYASFTNRAYQTAFTEDYSKHFFLRKTFLRTACQLREVTNLGLFHYGYSGSIIDGRDGILMEKPYMKFHLTCPRPGGRAKYASVLRALKEIDDDCRSNGVKFVCMLFPDKPQAYPEYLPRWFDWFWDYSNYNTQGEVAGLLREEGIDVFDATDYMLSRKARWEAWVYPPGGTHFSAYGCGLFYNGFLEQFIDTGRYDFKATRFVRAVPRDSEWFLDDDISRLLNTWRNPHLRTNVYYEPVWEQTNVVRNAGSAVVLGDCYRDQVCRVLRDSGFFARKKVYAAHRFGEEKPKGLEPYVDDLRLLVVAFQSFNTGRIDEREGEIRQIFEALRTARRRPRPAKLGERALPL